MPPVETAIGTPAKPAGDLRVYSPKASARKLHQRMQQMKNPSTEHSAPRGVRRFPGASSVASALGIRSGATPRGPFHTNIHSFRHHSKPDISTLLALGHFYFALTEQGCGLSLVECPTNSWTCIGKRGIIVHAPRRGSSRPVTGSAQRTPRLGASLGNSTADRTALPHYLGPCRWQDGDDDRR